MFERISIDPKICHGQWCIKGTRIPVHQIVGMLANGDTFESLLKAYPHIERDDISACLEYKVQSIRRASRLTAKARYYAVKSSINTDHG